MDPKNKGLADNQEGEFILNESGTSVSIDAEKENETAEEEPLDDNSSAESAEANS